VLYTGHSTTTQRDEAVKAFTTKSPESNGPTVFIATDAASEGLNLGKECSTLVNFDLPFKPSTIIQRSNRIHRVDGDVNKKYLVINFTIAKTLEEGILNMVGAKADIADAILGEAGTRRETTGRASRNLYHDALKEYSF
jgi:SNF2 family DNA or RNA helicase